MFEIKEYGLVTAEELIEVFESVGWNKDPDDIVEAFDNSYYIVCYYGTKLIGFARAISDDYYYTSIFDVVIRPEFQGKGLGRELVTRIVEKYQGTYFFLTHTEGQRGFYEKCGFKFNECGMWIPK